ncbi:GNAT family N-acetyltransferase [Luteibaculum oceani]|uniref:GNAT family N-acetyltransferase n=1 Tax=Luteibaculum oceani TaxID=1294296 RepID=A0A5C6VAF9_9FLAO|nr:GNAT family N-acetyltransferase [Luteibaculum oceani]TXC81501.1 GNAT family N-acetyltransferase [Luteibaculum oceani]
MNIKIVPFQNLALEELYNILKLRSEIFVVEQDCIYNDPDGADLDAHHLIASEKGKIIGTARIFAPGIKHEESSFGRLGILEDYRERGYAHDLVKEIHSFIKQQHGNVPVRIEAQVHLRAFYSRHGYVAEGASYNLDDIEHIQMLRPGF